jgi:hypothetical protein
VGISPITSGEIVRSTIVDNLIGVRASPFTGTSVVDSIVWSNTQYDVKDAGEFGPLVAYHCIVGSAYLTSSASALVNVLDDPPRFWHKAADDLNLRPLSPAIGNGTSGSTIGALPYDSAYAPQKPRVYCQSKPNSLGCLPSIGFVGTPSASGGPFDITLQNTLPGKQGLLFYGFQNKAVPYQGGWLCVVAPARRTPVQNAGGTSGCTGSYGYDFAARIASGVDPVLTAGQAVFAQYWYRDPLDPTGFTTGRSNALAFQVLP